MTERRFTDKPDLDPAAVRSLPPGHAALVENRTLFPTTVVTVDENFTDRLLISGRENRKLGETIIKGKFKGYALYGFSLEERATCPVDCRARGYCYGNGMQLARRHRIAENDPGLFFTLLEDEIRETLEGDAAGLMVRLHVLGDFPSVEYVGFWADALADHPKLACYGYTHRRQKKDGGDEIGDAIASAKHQFPERFRIRWSSVKSKPDGATIIDCVPSGPRSAAGDIVCPAQTDATACCASCGLCWEMASKSECIAFIKHGPKSMEVAAEAVRAETPGDLRPVQGLKLPPAVKPAAVNAGTPQVRLVAPSSLRVEAAYQRDLSGKSIKLIRKIVAGWDWTKFKPPVCAETAEGLFVIDGQHTAIAAASHPGIKEIPVMVVAAPKIEARAAAFVAHNRDRLTMTPAQVFFGDVIAGDKTSKAILDAVTKAGASIPRNPVARNAAKPGQVTAIGELRDIFATAGGDALARVLSIAVASEIAPISKTVLRALRIALSSENYRHVAAKPDAVISQALGGLVEDFERLALERAADAGGSKYLAAVELIADRASRAKRAAA